MGPCRKCQYYTDCGDTAAHRKQCEPAGLPRVSVQTLYALDIKIKDNLLNISVKANKSHKADLSTRISSNKDLPVARFHWCHFQAVIYVVLGKQ